MTTITKTKTRSDPRPRYRSYVAVLWATGGEMLLGGHRQTTSSRFSHYKDADAFLTQAIRTNSSCGRPCDGKVIPRKLTAEIVRHCGKAPTAVVGGRCGCGELITAALAAALTEQVNDQDQP